MQIEMKGDAAGVSSFSWGLQIGILSRREYRNKVSAEAAANNLVLVHTSNDGFFFSFDEFKLSGKNRDLNKFCATFYTWHPGLRKLFFVESSK